MSSITIRFDTPATAEELEAIASEIAATVEDDWGEFAWGGYDGPKLMNIRAYISEV